MSVVSMKWDSWQPGDDIALVGVGSGLTWSSFLLRVGGEA
jgi:3-oxoacyl-[acyl-carrier-protein] synthase III